MDPDLYDEFGNYIGPSLQSDSEEEEEYEDQENEVKFVKKRLFSFFSRTGKIIFRMRKWIKILRKLMK